MDIAARPIRLNQLNELRYGENQWQGANFYTQWYSNDPLELGNFVLEAGKVPSYTNLSDINRALHTLTHAVAALQRHILRPVFCAIAVKHGNACGAAYGNSPETALQKMIEGDLEAIFGGIVITNFAIGYNEASTLLQHRRKREEGKRVLDLVVAPSLTPAAMSLLQRKEDRCGMFSNETLAVLNASHLDTENKCRSVRKGYLVQDSDARVLDFNSTTMQVHGDRHPYWEADLAFAAALCRTSNSNTVTLVRDNMLIGQGVGQTKRSRAVWLAIEIAKQNGHPTSDSVAVSDSFFPFADAVPPFAEAGIKAVFSTSGSVRDAEVQEAFKKEGITLYQLPDSEARMFFGH